MLQPHFWCGFCAAVMLLACLAREHCTEPKGFPRGAPGRPQSVQLLCESNNAWAQDLRSLVVSAASFALESRIWLAHATYEFLDAAAYWRDAVLWPLFGWCPYRSAEDALQRCGQAAELQRVREAPDC